MRPSFLATLLLASVLAAPGCTPAPKYAFPVVQKYTTRPGDLFYFRPDDGRFVVLEGRGALAVAVAPLPRVQAYAHDTHVAVGRPSGGVIEITSFAQNISAQQALAITPDGQLLAGGDESGFVTLWDVASGDSPRRWKAAPTPVLAAAFSPDGSMLAVGVQKAPGASTATVRVWSLDAAAPRRAFGGRDVAALAWTPDGGMLAAGEANGTVLVAEVLGATAPRSLQSSTAAIAALDFHPGGVFLAVAHADKRVVLWKVPTGEAVYTFEPDVPADPLFPRGIERVAFDPGGTRLAVAYSDGDFRIWDTSVLVKDARK